MFDCQIGDAHGASGMPPEARSFPRSPSPLAAPPTNSSGWPTDWPTGRQTGVGNGNGISRTAPKGCINAAYTLTIKDQSKFMCGVLSHLLDFDNHGVCGSHCRYFLCTRLPISTLRSRCLRTSPQPLNVLLSLHCNDICVLNVLYYPVILILCRHLTTSPLRTS